MTIIATQEPGARSRDKKVELTQARSIQTSRDKLQQMEPRRAARLKNAGLKDEKEDKGSGIRPADEISSFHGRLRHVAEQNSAKNF